MPNPTIEVVGLAELRRDLKKLAEKDQLAQLREANLRVADMVVDAAQGKASTRLQQRAAQTLSAARMDRAAVRLGKGFAGALGAEFGAGRNKQRTGPSGRRYTGYNQFDEFRGSGDSAGYFLWPAIRDKTPDILEAYVDEIARNFGQ